MLDGFGQDGVTGLKSLGVRDLTYRMVFLASFICDAEEKNALSALHDMEPQDDQNSYFMKLEDEEKEQIEAMRADKRLYQKLATSIAPHIYGKFKTNYVYLITSRP